METPPIIQIEREVPPRVSDAPIIKGYLFRHPIIHFIVTFCYWFTGVSVLHFIGERWFGFFRPQPESYRLAFAFAMAVIFYATDRSRMRRSGPQKTVDMTSSI